MFATVDNFFTLGELTLTVCNFELAVENVVHADSGFFVPSAGSHVLGGWVPEDLLDDGLDGHVDNGRAGGAYGSRRSLDDATGSADKELGLAAGDFCFALGDGALAGDKGFCALGSQNTPAGVCVLGVSSGGRNYACDAVESVAVGEGEHDGEHGKYEREDEEEGGGGYCAVVVVATGGRPAL